MKLSVGRLAGLVLFIGLLLFWSGLWQVPLHVFAAADPGFTKVGTVAFGTNAFTDSTVVDGTTYSYEVTAQNAAGESGPSNVVTGSVPATGTHTASLSWTPGTGGGVPTTYNIYRVTVQIPNQPAALNLTIN